MIITFIHLFIYIYWITVNLMTDEGQTDTD